MSWGPDQMQPPYLPQDHGYTELEVQFCSPQIVSVLSNGPLSWVDLLRAAGLSVGLLNASLDWLRTWKVVEYKDHKYRLVEQTP